MRIMVGKVLYTVIIICLLGSCKKTADVPPVLISERLEITPPTNSVLIGASAQFMVKFYNNTGQQASVPSSVSWYSSNTAIATVNAQGMVLGLAKGQVEIKAFYNSLVVAALLNVVVDSSLLAKVNITNISGVKEIILNEAFALNAEGRNVVGQVLPGLMFNWNSNNSNLVQVDNAGRVTGKGYGTADIRASSSNIHSAPVMIQVIRTGNFVSMGSRGKAKLKIENNVLKLQTSSDFSVSNAPDLRMYLTNNISGVSNALEIATLNQRSGAQSWNIAAPTSITQYRYVMVWCKQFGGNYGYADLGN